MKHTSHENTDSDIAILEDVPRPFKNFKVKQKDTD